MRKLAFKLLALAASLAVAVVAAEVALRLAPQQGGFRDTRIVDRRSPTPLRWPEMAPVAARLAKPKPAGTTRIVVVGDSFTWGDGVYAADSYPVRLQRQLEQLVRRGRVDVLSWSQPGWNTRQAVASLAPQLEALEPDVVIVGYCLNDAEPSALEARNELRSGLDRWLEEPSRSRFYRASRLWRAVVESAENLASRWAVRAYYRSLYGEQPGWKAARRALRELAALADEHSFRTAVVVFPIFDAQLDDGYPYADLHTMVSRAARAAGHAVIDLLPHYRGIDARRLAVTPFTDPHPSELAHRIAADRIVDFLVAEDWVPVDARARARLEESRRLSGKGRPRGRPVG